MLEKDLFRGTGSFEFKTVEDMEKGMAWFQKELALESQMSDLRKEVEKKKIEHTEGTFIAGAWNSGYNIALDEVLLLIKAGEDK